MILGPGVSAMKRRDFMALLSGAAAWPVAARAQQPTDRVRRIGVLMPFTSDDSQSQARLMAFAQGLQQLGWAVGRMGRRRRGPLSQVRGGVGCAGAGRHPG